MKSLKAFSVVLATIIFNFSFAQVPDSVVKDITRSIGRAISKGHDHKKCKDFKSAVFSILITFSSDGKVEHIIFSESQNCFVQAKEGIEKCISENIDSLKIEKSIISNRFLLTAIYVVPHESDGASSNTNKIPEDWQQLFRGIDFNQLNGKTHLCSIPIGISLLPRIKK